jgi:type IV pilus assembly protein PilM
MLFERPLIAVDIGSSSIKMMEISGKTSARSLKSYGVELIPTGAIDDGVIQDSAAVIDAVARLASKMGVKGRRAAVSLAGSGVLIRKVSVPSGKDASIEDQIPFHAEQAFQLDPAGLYYDFVQLPQRATSAGETDVLLVGARRETVEQYVACVKDAGLKLGVIECNAFSLFNAFEHNYGTLEGLLAIVNIGASYTQIAFLNNGVFMFNRDIAVGGSTYTRRIMELSGKSYEESEAIKLNTILNSNGRPNPNVQSVINEINDQLVHELHGTLAYFLKAGEIEAGTALKCVFLTGGASRSPGLDAAIAASLQAPVYPLNPFQRIEVNERKFQLESIAGVSFVLGVAAGLGLRQMMDKE